MYSTSDFRKGLKIMHEDAPWEVVDFQHVKPGKGHAFMRAKLRNLLTGSVVEKKFRTSESFAVPDLEFKRMQYLYPGDGYVVMDLETYDQITFTAEQLGEETISFLKENQDLDVVFYQGEPLTVSLPNHLVLTVAETDPGFKGDTASGGTTKPATLETGAKIQVPLFIKEGDRVKVDTRTGEYIERISE